MTETKYTISLECFHGPHQVEAECVGEWGMHVAYLCTCGNCWVVTHIESGIGIPAVFRKRNARRMMMLAQALVVGSDGSVEKDKRAAGRKLISQCDPLSRDDACLSPDETEGIISP